MLKNHLRSPSGFLQNGKNKVCIPRYGWQVIHPPNGKMCGKKVPVWGERRCRDIGPGEKVIILRYQWGDIVMWAPEEKSPSCFGKDVVEMCPFSPPGHGDPT